MTLVQLHRQMEGPSAIEVIQEGGPLFVGLWGELGVSAGVGRSAYVAALIIYVT